MKTLLTLLVLSAFTASAQVVTVDGNMNAIIDGSNFGRIEDLVSKRPELTGDLMLAIRAYHATVEADAAKVKTDVAATLAQKIKEIEDADKVRRESVVSELATKKAELEAQKQAAIAAEAAAITAKREADAKAARTAADVASLKAEAEKPNANLAAIKAKLEIAFQPEKDRKLAELAKQKEAIAKEIEALGGK